jgi:hypothetical protein
MKFDQRLTLLVAVTIVTALAAALATQTRRRHVRAKGELEHRLNLRSWENEGGNLAPIPAPPVHS